MSAQGKPPPERFNFAQDILERNAGRAGKTAYVDDAVELTYGELDARVRSAAAAYVALGLRREERVLLCLHDTVDFPVAFLGALYAGIVPVAVNTMLTADDYAYMLAHSRAKALVVSGVLLPALNQALAQALGRGGHDVQNVIVSRAATSLPEAALDFATWIGAAAAMPRAVDTAAEEMAFWLYSSGSTGRPKGTVHTHANLHWTAELYGKPVLGLVERDVVFSAAKLFFAYGLGNALTFPLSVGATTVLMAERATPQAVFLRLLQASTHDFLRRSDAYAALLSSPTCRSARMSRCAGAFPRVKRCRARWAKSSPRASAAKFWTASARPRCCTSSCPIRRAMSATERQAGRCPATRSNCGARTVMWSLTT